MTPLITDLSTLRFRDIQGVIELLEAYIDQDIPDNFDNNQVQIGFNGFSGDVYLTNRSEQTLELIDNKLELSYKTPCDEHEGTLDDLVTECDDSWDIEDLQFVLELQDKGFDFEDLDKNKILQLIKEI